MSVERLGIVGVGLIGGSIALRARAARGHVVGFDQDAATLARALARGAIDTVAPDLESLAADCDTLVIALPVDATGSALHRLAGRRTPPLVIDVASVKAPFVELGRAIASYVGTHPMAGRERGGIDAAEADLFVRATWAYCPHPDADLIGRTRTFIAAMGATPLEIDPVQHDAIVALSSHLPQVLSVLLGAQLRAADQNDPRVMELCGPGMMSMLRLAQSPATTWSPIVRANAGPLAERLRSFGRALETAAAGLEVGDGDPLMAYFEVAREAAVLLEERLPTTRRSSAYRSPAP